MEKDTVQRFLFKHSIYNKVFNLRDELQNMSEAFEHLAPEAYGVHDKLHLLADQMRIVSMDLDVLLKRVQGAESYLVRDEKPVATPAPSSGERLTESKD